MGQGRLHAAGWPQCARYRPSSDVAPRLSSLEPLYEHIRAPDGDECGLTGALNDVNSGWGYHLDTKWSLIYIFGRIVEPLATLHRAVESRVVEKTGWAAKNRRTVIFDDPNNSVKNII